VAGIFECGSEPWGSIKCGESRDLTEDLLANQERLRQGEFATIRT
jgi:hypothetical protein